MRADKKDTENKKTVPGKKKVKSKKKRAITFSILGVIILLLLVAGIYSYYLFSNTKSNDTKIAVKKIPEDKITIVNPDSKSRIWAFTIDNVDGARPQQNIQNAFVVYELLVEGGATRFLALYKDANLDIIGPVRSVRHYFLDEVLENDAFLVHFGESPQAQKDMSTLNMDQIDGITAGNVFWRSNSYDAPHNAFTSSERVNSYMKDKNIRTTSDKKLLLNYKAKPVVFKKENQPTTANKVDIYYSDFYTSYEYDPTNKNYKKSTLGKPHLDGKTNKQITTKNIITYSVPMFLLANDPEDKGRMDWNNLGTGKGFYISNGESEPITWEKTARDSQPVFKTLDGKELEVNDGNTFINITPQGQKTLIS